ncbi:CAP-Gly domain [Nesidiocoris tenuis]|nr:CAP-Gly domain [Nesidiocoris tenuis]
MEDQNCRTPSVGQRIQVGDSRGTVMYVGPVPPTKGIWLGIDWDDPSRGKHDGVYDGQRYFQARYSTSGSLVRLEKVNLGQTIVEAVKERYGADKQLMDEKEKEEIQKALNAPLFETVGFERQACENFGALTVLGLSLHRVASAGEPGDLAKLCPHVSYLELSRNLLNSWQTVADITTGLNRLTVLDLSENRLRFQDCDLVKVKNAIPKFQFLSLSRVEYDWDDILTCAVMWPSIATLEVSFNNITFLKSPPSDIFQNLRNLDLQGNHIKDWSEIAKIGHLPLLDTLNASETGLTRISIDESSNPFPSLRFLLLSDNYINQWESVSELNKLRKLTELKFKSNPVLDGIAPGTARQIIIARISTLKVLNSQEVPADERRGAEYDYLKITTRTWMDVRNGDPDTKSAFFKLHPRYAELIKQYGEIEASEIAEIPTTLKSRLMEVKLSYQDSTVSKKLSPDMTVSRLKSLARRIFSITSYENTFVLVSHKNTLVEIDLDLDMKPLSYYSLESGDIIRIS